MYLTFQDYTEMGGKLLEPAFVRYERLASAEVDRQTLRRMKIYAFEYVPTPPTVEPEPPIEPEEPPVEGISEEPAPEVEPLPVPQELKNLIFELVELNAAAQTAERMTTSQSNNGVSVTYADADRKAIASRERELMKMFLGAMVDEDGVPVLYTGIQGVRTCCHFPQIP